MCVCVCLGLYKAHAHCDCREAMHACACLCVFMKTWFLLTVIAARRHICLLVCGFLCTGAHGHCDCYDACMCVLVLFVVSCAQGAW